jgi:hypothetical protein
MEASAAGIAVSGPELETSWPCRNYAFPWPLQRKHVGIVLKKVTKSCVRLAQATRRTLF